MNKILKNGYLHKVAVFCLGFLRLVCMNVNRKRNRDVKVFILLIVHQFTTID